MKKGALVNFTKFTGKHLCQGLYFNEVKKELRHRCFPVNFVKFLRTPYLQSTSEQLLLIFFVASLYFPLPKFSPQKKSLRAKKVD